MADGGGQGVFRKVPSVLDCETSTSAFTYLTVLAIFHSGFSDVIHVPQSTHPVLHAMDGEGGGQPPREVPSAALDRLFLELHDQLPRDARERFAQLADEVKRLAESITAEDPVIPSPSADQAVVRREEEIATAEAKQSSGELQAQGRAY